VTLTAISSFLQGAGSSYGKKRQLQIRFDYSGKSAASLRMTISMAFERMLGERKQRRNTGVLHYVQDDDVIEGEVGVVFDMPGRDDGLTGAATA